MTNYASYGKIVRTHSMPQSPSNHYHSLQEKWSKRHILIKKSFREKHKNALSWVSTSFPYQKLSAGTLGGLMLLTAPSAMAYSAPLTDVTSTQQYTKDIDKKIFLVSDLSNKVPKEVRPLIPEEEDRISNILSERFGITVKAEINGKRLNRTYGYIGAEQHLARFPGDTIQGHFENVDDATKYYASGMAPGLGSWRYFASGRLAMTKEESDQEKWYIAVQTFLSPHFYEKVKDYMAFYKYRKMLVVNPENGKALIADIADSGPSVWTGKHLGGSPEVMKYLERVDGKAKGPVLYFFIDDKNNTVPLGPIEVQ